MQREQVWMSMSEGSTGTMILWASRVIRDLLLVAKIRREDDRIGVIANRVRRNTLTYQSLIRFLHTLGIPIVATLRDSQNYVRAAELGVGVHEMKHYVAHEDTEQWAPLVEWLARPRPVAKPPGAAPAGSAEVPGPAVDPAPTDTQPVLEKAMAELPPLPAAVSNA